MVLRVSSGDVLTFLDDDGGLVRQR
jgi:hypothetical protein